MILTMIFSLFFLNFSANAEWGKNENVNENPLVATPDLTSLIGTPGGRLNAKINLSIDKEFKAYQDKFLVTFKKPSDFILRNFDVNPTYKFFDPISKKDRMGFKGTGELTIDVEIPKQMAIGKHKLLVNFGYQACTQKLCLFPKTIPLNLEIDIRASLPTDASSSGGFWSNINFEQANKMGTFFAFLFVFLAGVLTSLTPCVYPMIPITLAVLGSKGADHSPWKGFLVSFSYVSGIGVMFSSLGILAATSGRLFGSMLGHPIVVSFVSFVFFLMALSMFGFFEFQAPLWLQDKAVHLKSKGKYLSAFLTGIVAGIVAAPCVGPVIISILTHVAQTKNIAYGFSLLFFYSLGMGLLFLGLGTFSQFTRYLPKSGKWMSRVKVVFGIVMLGMSMYYVSPVVLKKYGYKPSDLPSFFSVKPQNTVRIKFIPYSSAEYKKALEDKKPIFIDFYADWCAACIELEEKTYVHPEVAELAKQFVAFQFDATSDSDELQKLKEMFDIKGLPTVLFIDKKGTWVKDLTLTGFEEGPQFLERMKKSL